jgi:hypothetical protein
MARTTSSSRFNKDSQRIIFKRHGNRCVHCGEHFQFEELTRDHIIPASRGGTMAWINIVPACRSCNEYRGDEMFHVDDRSYYLALAREYFEYMKEVWKRLERRRRNTTVYSFSQRKLENHYQSQ